MGWRFVSAVGNLKAAREETWEAARPGSRHRVSQAWHENNPAPHNVGLAGPAVSQQSQYTVSTRTGQCRPSRPCTDWTVPKAIFRGVGLPEGPLSTDGAPKIGGVAK